MEKRAAFLSLGCKVNAYETEAMQKLFENEGYTTVSFDDEADVYVVNTCTVTNIADRKSRQMLHKAHKQNPGAVVIAVGCYVQAPQCILTEDDAVDILVGNNEKSKVFEYYQSYMLSDEEGRKRFKGHPSEMTADYEQLFVDTAGEHTRANIKIQDGCNQFCSYCIIPYVRGRIRSRRLENIISEAQTLAQKGYRELVLTGIHLSSYGIDIDNTQRLIEVIEALQKIDGIDRIRLGSLEPRIVTPEFAGRMAACSKLCPHFHLSLQSGCEATLKRMNRHYTPEEYKRACDILRSVYDDPAITTDIIVGFPGETEEEFNATVRFAEEIGFSKIHIFPYSQRTGTNAAKMKDQIGDNVKKERAALLASVEECLARKYRGIFIGRKEKVLFEEKVNIDGKDYYVGHTERYIRVAAESETDICGKICDVDSLSFFKDDILSAKVIVF